MGDELNLIRNPTLAEGAKRPRDWFWSAGSDDVDWTRGVESDGAAPVVIITSSRDTAAGGWTQRIRCKPNEWYRIEAVVSCQCAGEAEHAGAGLWITPATDKDETGHRIRLAGALRTSEPLTLRAYYKTPQDTRWLDVEVGLCQAAGTVTIHSVYVAANLEPDTTSHPLALPPPPYAYPAPVRARRVCVCDDGAEDRPLTTVLRQRLGPRAVEHLRVADLNLKTVDTDVLIIARDLPPKAIRSLAALERVAADRLVIISLEAFAKLAGDDISVRAIDQADDPLCAEVYDADFITRGFALRDVFPFASSGKDPRGFRQRQFRRGAAFNALCENRDYRVVLRSMTDQDASSHLPICLYKPVDGGGVIVCDVDSVEGRASSFGEPNIAAFVLFNMLGLDQTSLGQYAVPAETETEWIETLMELAVRYPALVVSGRTRDDFIVELGTPMRTPGLPQPHRPMILIRTGLRGDDMPGIYGTMWYFKQLVRPEPYENPYVRGLVDRFRLAWIPLCAPWQDTGWDASLAVLAHPVDAEFERGALAAVIDITDTSHRRHRVVYDRDDDDFARQATLLPALAADFAAGRYFYRAGEVGSHIDDHSRHAWQTERLIPAVAVDRRAFDSDFHRAARDSGARVIRIEIPGSNTDFVCNSIWRTDLAATTLEHVIGLQYGLTAVNRLSGAVTFDGHRPLQPGEGIVLDADAREAAVSPKQAG